MTITPVSVTDVTVQEICEQAAEELKLITGAATSIIRTLTQEVRSREAVAKGRVLAQIKERLPNYESYKAFLSREDVCVSVNASKQWICAYQLHSQFGDKIYQLSPKVLHRMSGGLSAGDLEFHIEEAINSGKGITVAQSALLTNTPELKLNFFVERLEEASADYLERKNEYDEYRRSRDDDSTTAKNDPVYRQKNSAYKNAETSVALWQEKIDALRSQLELEQAKATSAEASQKAAEEKLDQVLFDEDTAASLQVKRVGYNLQNMVPQVLADLQRFTSERQRYPEELRLHIEDQTRQLLHYLTKHYA